MSEYIFIIIYLLLAPLFSYHFIASLQLNNYKILKLIDINNKKYIKFIVYNLTVSFVFLIINIVQFLYYNNYIYISNIVYFIVFIILLVKNKNNFAKTPLKFTNRIKRFYILNFLVNITINTIFILYLYKFINLLVPIYTVINMLAVIVTYYLILPFEKLNNFRYILQAKHRFNNKNLIKIAITGSYAKTSVKTILGHILSYKYNVEYSLKNYNTELGLSITSNLLKKDTDIFIAEFGAKNKKDILKLVKIFNPNIAVITGICNQHLETFKTIENIISTKKEILYNNPISYFNGNNKYVKNIYDNYNGEKHITYNENCYISDINFSNNGTYFTLNICNTKAKCYTKLLGTSALENILLSSLIAYNLGMDLQLIAKSILNLPYIEHRLQVKIGRYTIIDDSYNSNEKGVLEALNVLKLFNGNKYVFVSGLIELGNLEKSINYNLGENLARVSDFIILIKTKQSKYILDALFDCKFNKKNIYIYNSTKEAIDNFDKIILDNSTLLLMSDLPSNYSV